MTRDRKGRGLFHEVEYQQPLLGPTCTLHKKMQVERMSISWGVFFPCRAKLE